MDRLTALHWRQPVGPLPAAVYWQRRAAVLLAAVLVLAVLVALLGRLGGSEPDALGQQDPGPSARPSASPSGTPGAPAPACPPGALRVEADAAPAEVPAGSGADLRVAVTNTSAETCSVRLGAAAVQLVVLSGSDRIWSSSDCDGAPPSPPALDPTDALGDGRADLAAGERRLVVVAWDGRRSRPGCPGGGEVARPGTYRVLARVGAIAVEGRPFRVV